MHVYCIWHVTTRLKLLTWIYLHLIFCIVRIQNIDSLDDDIDTTRAAKDVADVDGRQVFGQSSGL